MSAGEELRGTYGSGHTPCTVYWYKGWYCVDGSVNVNRTHEELEDGVDVECVDDYDTFTAPFPVDSLEELIRFVDEDDEVIEDDDEDEFNDEDDE